MTVRHDTREIFLCHPWLVWNLISILCYCHLEKSAKWENLFFTWFNMKEVMCVNILFGWKSLQAERKSEFNLKLISLYVSTKHCYSLRLINREGLFKLCKNGLYIHTISQRIYQGNFELEWKMYLEEGKRGKKNRKHPFFEVDSFSLKLWTTIIFIRNFFLFLLETARQLVSPFLLHKCFELNNWCVCVCIRCISTKHTMPRSNDIAYKDALYDIS